MRNAVVDGTPEDAKKNGQGLVYLKHLLSQTRNAVVGGTTETPKTIGERPVLF